MCNLSLSASVPHDCIEMQIGEYLGQHMDGDSPAQSVLCFRSDGTLSASVFQRHVLDDTAAA